MADIENIEKIRSLTLDELYDLGRVLSRRMGEIARKVELRTETPADLREFSQITKLLRLTVEEQSRRDLDIAIVRFARRGMAS